jgi:hypothetical protein
MKKKMKEGLVVVVVIVAILMLSSYAGALSPEEIRDLVLNNSSEVDAYKFDMNMTIDVLTGNETNVTELAIKGNGSGERDCVNKSLWMAMNVNVNTSENEGEDTTMNAILSMLGTIEMDMYLINNTLYSKVDLGIPFMPVLWIKMERPVGNKTYNNTYNDTYNESQWASKDQLELQRALLNCANVTLLEDEVVDAIDCYVLKLELDLEKLLQFLMNQTTMGEKEIAIPGFGNLMDNSQETENGNVTEENGNTIDMVNMTMTEWIAKDTKFVMRAEATLDRTTRSDTEKGATIALDVKTKYYDYNVPVSIVLPPEADGAIDSDEILGIDFGDLLGMPPGIN